MNYFLFLIIIGVGYGGYYECTTLQQKSAVDQQLIADLSAKINTLQLENKKLEDDKAQQTKSVDDAQTKIAALTRQVKAAQSALAETEAQKQALQVPKATTAAVAPAAPAHSTNDLGTITMLDGKTCQHCQLLKVKATGIVINDSDGITEISYSLLPPDLQKKFGYDPHQAAVLTEAQIEYQEDQRKAADQTIAN